jgi:universal stress protein A
MKTATAPRKRAKTAARPKASVARGKPVAIKRILVPLDGSDHALKALHYAVHFAKLFGSRIDSLRVVEPRVYPNGLSIPQRSYNQDDLALKLARAQSREIGGRMIPDGIKWRNRVVSGNPYAEVVDYARKEKTDLLIITTHGHTGLKHFLLGSNAEKITRHAPCPVLVVRDREHDFV